MVNDAAESLSLTKDGVILSSFPDGESLVRSWEQGQSAQRAMEALENWEAMPFNNACCGECIFCGGIRDHGAGEDEECPYVAWEKLQPKPRGFLGEITQPLLSDEQLQAIKDAGGSVPE